MTVLRPVGRLLSPLRRPAEQRRAQMTILEHLEELRFRLVWVGGSVAVAAVAGWLAFEQVVQFLLRPALPYLTGPTGTNLITTHPLEVFVLRLKVAVYLGFVIAFPMVLFQFWRFVSPGLHERERKYAIPFVGFGMVLFVTGIAFGYYSLSQALQFLIGPLITGDRIVPMLSARQYLDFVLLYLVLFGFAFQFPLVLMSLSLARIVTSKQMGRYRRQVLVGTALAASLLTPPDWYTMVVLTVVLYGLYEGCIWLSRLLRR